MLAPPGGDLRVMTSSSESMRVVELVELQSQEGPCRECFRSGQPVVAADLSADGVRWPPSAAVALGAGLRAAGAIPMRLRCQVIGALNLFRTGTASLITDDVDIAETLANLATIVILQHSAAIEAKSSMSTQPSAAQSS
jgi:GAF domain-containing protein